MSISDRLKIERKKIGLNQGEFAALAGAHKVTQARYESGARCPDADYLAALHDKGVDIQYLITGQTALTKRDLSLVLDAFIVINEKLGNKKMSMDKRKELALALYDLYKETDSTSEKLADTVLKLAVNE